MKVGDRFLHKPSGRVFVVTHKVLEAPTGYAFVLMATDGAQPERFDQSGAELGTWAVWTLAYSQTFSTGLSSGE